MSLTHTGIIKLALEVLFAKVKSYDQLQDEHTLAKHINLIMNIIINF